MSRFSRTDAVGTRKPYGAKLSWNGQSSILLVSMLAVSAAVVYPLLCIFKNSLVLDGVFNLSAYVEVFTSAKTYKALANTLIVATGVLCLTGAAGGALAFLVEKTDFRFRRQVRFLAFLAFCIPSYILSVSWIQVTARGGYLHRLLRLIDMDYAYSFSPYSLSAVIVVLSVHLYPLVFFGVSGALRRNRGSLADAARVSGATPPTVLRSVLLPLVMPSFLSTGLLVFSRTMANFGIPAQLLLPVGGEVLTTRIYKAISELDIASLSVLSILLMAVSGAMSLWMERWIRTRAFDASGSGRASNADVLHLGGKAWIVNAIVGVFFLTVLAMPLATLLLSSLMKRWGLAINLGNMTLHNYALILFENPMMKRAFANSLIFGLLSAGTATALAVVVVYLSRYANTRAGKLLTLVASLPLAMPNIILAVGAVFAWINPPFKLYGTKWILILTYTVLFLPIVIRQIGGLSANVEPAIDLSARTLGIPAWRRILRLFLPQVARGAAAGFMISFLIAFRELPISLLLYSKGNETAGVLLFTIQSNSYGLEMTSAIAVLVILICVTGNIIVDKISGKSMIDEDAAD